MTAMTNCILCFNEFAEEYKTCYPPKLHDLCCKYLHSSLTQETLLRQSEDLNFPFCQKCFVSVVELDDLNDELKFYQKRVSEFVFILSLEILHRRGDGSNDQNRPNPRNPERKQVEFDVSALPNCDFKKDIDISEEIETSSPQKDHNLNSEDFYEDFYEPLLIPSIPSANTVKVTFNKIKVETDNHSWVDDETHNEITATKIIETDFSIENADHSFSTGQIENKILNPIVTLQRLNFQGSDQNVISVENDQDKLNRPIGNGGMKSRTVWTKSDFGSSFKITNIQKNSASVNCSPQISCVSTINPIANSSSNGQIPEEKLSSDVTKTFVCDQIFSTVQESEVHAADHSKESQYNCDVCGKIFITKEYLLKHKMTHTEEPHHMHATGKRRFKSKRHLQSHKTVHKKQMFKCEVCGKEFVIQSSLRRHRRIHTGERPYKCEVCGQGFRQKSHLKIHTVVHTDERGFKCEVCGKRFKLQCHLKSHTIVHTDERGFKCEVCGKEFKHQNSLAKHSKIHSGERPHKSVQFCTENRHDEA